MAANSWWIGATLALALGCGTTPQAPPRVTPEADPLPTPSGEIPGQSQGDLDRGMAYAQNGAFAEAIPFLERAAAAEPRNAQTLAKLGYCYEQAGRRPEAMKSYEQAIAADPKLTDARANLAAMYLDEPAQPEKAIAVLEPAIQLQPDAPDLRLNLAYAYRLAKQPDKAAEQYRAALAKQDKRETRLMLADVLGEAGKQTEQVAELEKLAASENDAKNLDEIGWLLRNAKAFSQCVDAFNKAIKIDAKRPQLYVRRGICRHALKQDEEKVSDDYRKAIEIDAKFQPAWYYLGSSLLAQRKRAEARDAFDKCIKLGADTPIGKQAADMKDTMIRQSTGRAPKGK